MDENKDYVDKNQIYKSATVNCNLYYAFLFLASLIFELVDHSPFFCATMILIGGIQLLNMYMLEASGHDRVAESWTVYRFNRVLTVATWITFSLGLLF